MNGIWMKQQNNINILLNSQKIRKSNEQYWYSREYLKQLWQQEWPILGCKKKNYEENFSQQKCKKQ
jgi:hypothetical protein